MIIDNSSEYFDTLLNQHSHFQRFPKMRPFVGENYIDDSHKKLLLLGESGYFPPNSIIHKDAVSWYENNEKNLTDEECDYYNWRNLVGKAWINNGHEMYRSINRSLKEVLTTNADRAVSHIAYTNSFYRPAEEPGESIKHFCSPLDIEKSLDITSHVIQSLAPDIVVFVTKYSWDNVGWRIAEQFPNIQFEFTAHPADRRWWNRANYEHGKDKFISILEDNYLI